ncbi:hypothetical protein M3Y95_00096800 [Aphelenchoides besseyi]|nr:hypothetical protein M3Y95_00096800 [Aphelenchoides besseyi]
MLDENAETIQSDHSDGLPVQRHSDSISLCVTPSEEPSNVDINRNLSNSSDMFADRCRRRSSRLANLKSDLIANGACFRPPFTPSNSFSRCDGFSVSPRGSIIELDSSRFVKC